ncbi:hypothetical protein JZ751_009095 [Albula glossodonta]|uniref:Gem-associated protein 4 n=1 Tax=Albula glossodonta TaxID=121402 RepID=A0A8T2N134_9TELE|nr:hypothetical protein JZ751_009095 [Albula glossodonta]
MSMQAKHRAVISGTQLEKFWLSCEKTAILQGGFLLAEKLCSGGKLCTVRKEEWGSVAGSVLQAVTEVCGKGHGASSEQILWRKKIICALWSKLLETEERRDIDVTWRENPFFSLQNVLPQINRTVLFELVKSVGFSWTYVELLLSLPPAGLCSELASLVKHITADSTKEDAQLLMDVWWGLWKGTGRQDQALDQAFAAHYFSSTHPCSTTTSCVPSILFSALEEMKDCILSSGLCHFALSNVLNTFYTSFLLDREVSSSPELYLQSLSKAVYGKERQASVEGHCLTETVQEAQRELAATNRPSQFRPCGVNVMQAAWGKGLLKVQESCGQRPNAVCLNESLHRAAGALEELMASETLAEGEKQDASELICTLKNFMESVALRKWPMLPGLNSLLPSSFSEGFGEELNLSFNSITQSQAESSFGLAVSAVARIALQDPEATLHRCCHMAVMNLGAGTVLARILQQLPGLTSQRPRGSEGKSGVGESLLCSALQEAVWGKLSTPQEEKQFLSFLAMLMHLKTVTEDSKEEGLSLLSPEMVVRTFVLPYLSPSSAHTCSLELCLQVLLSAFKQDSHVDSGHWVMGCSPFPLLIVLSQLLNDSYSCWEQPAEGAHNVSIEAKDLLISALTVLGELVGREVAAAPAAWSRALSWLHSKLETLDWTVHFHLKSVLGGHFKNEVPCSLLSVCNLSDHEWMGVRLPQYGQGTGLLAWAECCSGSDLGETMLSSLALDQNSPDQVTMFSKGLLVAMAQTLPWCTMEEWGRLLRAVRELLESGRLYVPYSLEYVDFLPLLDLRPFACELRLSVLLLRVLQLLCGASCEDWLPARGWMHVGHLYAGAIRETLGFLKEKLPLAPSAPPSSPKSNVLGAGKEGLFVLTQLFCHVMHVHVMLPSGAEPLFLCALEILTLCQSLLKAHPDSSSTHDLINTRHFLKTITDNLVCAERRAALHQKIAQL